MIFSHVAKLVLVLVLCFIFSESILATVLPTKQPPSLFVVIAGNGSCRRKTTFQNIPGLIDTQLFQSFVQTMLNKGAVTNEDHIIFACYEWQSPQMKYYERNISNYMSPIHESQLDQVVLRQASHFQRIVIIGHSHAGWRAMKLASSPLLLNTVQVPILLATIDPVSRIQCQRLRDPGCRHAPTDLSKEEFSQLKTRTHWLNLYHQPAKILGSSPIREADCNVKVDANHVLMQTDPLVWKNIYQFVRSHYERN
ncbi:MAG: hypothetical protein EBR01_11500 [Proteobacteria bacterium]|nr:hypothetical protein [Pseudomonadota bacterium]